MINFMVVLCFLVITEDYKARTVGPRSKVEFDCDERGHTVESKRLTGEMILGNNGVVYMIDDVLIPDRGKLTPLIPHKKLKGVCILIYQKFMSRLSYYSIFAARTLLELAESRHLQTFSQLIKIGGLDDLFNDLGNYTLFAPSEEALYCKFITRTWLTPHA